MTQRPTDRLVGDVLDGRYEVLQRLARGGMATVYRAWDRRLERIVAIKVMHDGLGDDADFVAKFDREARAAARLCDENVVSIFDQGFDHGRPYIVMEFVEGSTLRSIITRDAPMSPLRVMQLIEPVAAALAVAHEAGLVHRDVKPENVLISHRGEIKVADFGLARTISSQTSTTTQGLLIGTVSYLPPELLTTGRAQSWSDVYSTGIVIFEMLTGTKPYTGDAPITVAYKHVNENVPNPSEVLAAKNPGQARREPIPDYVDALVAACTRRNPAARPANGRELLRRVRRVRRALERGVKSDDALCALVYPAAALPWSHAPTTALDPDQMATSVLADHSARLPVAAQAAPVVTAPKAALQTRTDRRVGYGGSQPAGATPTAESAVIPRRSEPVPAAPRTTHQRIDPPTRVGGAEAAQAIRPRQFEEAPRPASERYPRLSRSATYRRRRAFVATIVIVLLALIIGMTSWWFASGRYVAAPSVVNMTQAEAESAASGVGLTISFTEEYSETVPTDLVISSNPGAGDDIVRGSQMSAVVSLGPERFAVPSLAGLTLDDAQQALADANLATGTLTEQWSETVTAGLVIDAGYAAGELVKRDTAVDLTISQGREPLAIPNVVGKTKDEAVQSLTDVGFQVEWGTEEVSKDVPKDSVVSQSPADGTGYRGDTVTLVLSKGANLTKVPTPKSKEKPQAYFDRLTDAKFSPEFVYSGANLGPNVGKITKVTDEDGNELSSDSELPEGAKIKVYVSL
ncbi:PASTA domain-containing protein [Propionimicrobium sp. PCR01-08-3]|uniref:protein kinase domain-containing protein n=1 Tax=Propionimicrobium sp. PCR01-08-3 TaxID=3052086 RepID=UPI00255CAC02|nr:PASTA domain-containing protein [Propionimicrobium sp. PCR01-08-3]WIY81669.1 PASTA domain-containing protein [Propionimicrobium sp. PCR01-08-3]